MQRIIPGTNYSTDSPLGEIVDVSLLRTITKIITNDEIKKLPVEPTSVIEIVAAPPIGKAIIPILSYIFANQNIADNPYADFDPDDKLQLVWGNVDSNTSQSSSIGTPDSPISFLLGAGPYNFRFESIYQYFNRNDEISGMPLGLRYIAGPGIPLTGGNKNNQLIISINYMLLDIPN